METDRRLGQVFPPPFFCLFLVFFLLFLLSFSFSFCSPGLSFCFPLWSSLPIWSVWSRLSSVFLSISTYRSAQLEGVLHGHSVSPFQLKLSKQLISLPLSCVLSELYSLVCAARRTLDPSDKKSWGEQEKKEGEE